MSAQQVKRQAPTTDAYEPPGATRECECDAGGAANKIVSVGLRIRRALFRSGIGIQIELENQDEMFSSRTREKLFELGRPRRIRVQFEKVVEITLDGFFVPWGDSCVSSLLLEGVDKTAHRRK